jgi:hypothetical protein
MKPDTGNTRARDEFIVLTALIILTRFFDLASTYILTPNLQYESNPLITSFDFKWQGFLIVQLLISTLVIWVNYFSLFKSKIEYPKEKGLNFNEFQMYYMFGRGVEAENFWSKLLGVFKVNLAFVGYLLPRALIIFSTFIIVIHSLLFNGIKIPQYYLYTFYCILLFSVVLFNKLYHRVHYKVYKNM